MYGLEGYHVEELYGGSLSSIVTETPCGISTSTIRTAGDGGEEIISRKETGKQVTEHSQMSAVTSHQTSNNLEARSISPLRR
jgi:hypothetical protein